MNIADLQTLLESAKADGFKGRKLIREMANRTNLDFEELRKQMRSLPDYSRYNADLNGIILNERRKRKNNQEDSPELPPDYAESGYMEHLTPIWNEVKELNEKEKSAQKNLDMLKQKRKNLVATLKNFLTFAESGKNP